MNHDDFHNEDENRGYYIFDNLYDDGILKYLVYYDLQKSHDWKDVYADTHHVWILFYDVQLNVRLNDYSYQNVVFLNVIDLYDDHDNDMVQC